MWLVFGVVYIVISSNVLQIVETKQYNSPQACWAAAMTVMKDGSTAVHMSCVPVFREEGTES